MVYQLVSLIVTVGKGRCQCQILFGRFVRKVRGEVVPIKSTKIIFSKGGERVPIIPPIYRYFGPKTLFLVLLGLSLNAFNARTPFVKSGIHAKNV